MKISIVLCLVAGLLSPLAGAADYLLNKPAPSIVPPGLLHSTQSVEQSRSPLLINPLGAKGASSSPAHSSCSRDGFISRSGTELTDFVSNAPLACVNDLFSLTGTHASQVFSEQKMLAVANAFQHEAFFYSLGNDNGILQLIVFLRAGYYVQFFNSDDVPAYSSQLGEVVKQALGYYFSAMVYAEPNDKHGQILTEAIILISSAQQYESFFWIVQNMLNWFDHDYAASFGMRQATNSLFSLLFRVHDRPQIIQRVAGTAAYPENVLNMLQTFIVANDYMIGGDGEVLLNNAARELGRFLQHDQLKVHIRSNLKSLLSHYSLSHGAGIWAGIAEMVNAYDSDRCADYGTCHYQQTLSSQLLPISYHCTDAIVIRAQHMTADQLSSSCQQLAEQSHYFHQIFPAANQPVAGDLNNTLEVVVFDSRYDYQTFSGVIFGNSINNGGIYLEGNPADAANQARYIAYEANSEVWNLRHEFVHYLDGRFNMQGGFNDYLGAHTIWWIEGLAEYLSHRDINPQATQLAATGQYHLSEIFHNSYNSDSELVYRWGYLAVRFMFERHPEVVQQILGYFRAGNYQGYNQFIQAHLTTFDSEWHSWLAQLNPTAGSAIPNACTSQTAHTDYVDALQDQPRMAACVAANHSVVGNFWVPEGTSRVILRVAQASHQQALYLKTNGYPTVNEYDYTAQENDGSLQIVINNPESTYHYFLLGSGARDTTVQVILE